MFFKKPSEKTVLRKCLLISGGDFSVPENFSAADFDFIISCDKGFEYAQKLGIKSDLIIGDFDSCSVKPEKTEGTSIIQLEKDKDFGDTMTGVKYAIAQGYNDFTVICGGGGRLDQLFGNLQTLSYIAEKGGKVRMLSAADEVYVIKNSSITIPRKIGWSLSVYSLSDFAKGVFERGTKWKLENAEMPGTLPMGLSNEWAEEKAEIGVKRGILIIILSKLN